MSLCVFDIENALFQGLKSLTGEPTGAEQRVLASLRLTDGGLAFGGVRRRSAAAFLASWAFCFKEVAGVVGASSLQGFRARCPGIANVIAAAEASLRGQGGNGGAALPWHDYLAEASPKQQAAFGVEISRRPC